MSARAVTTVYPIRDASGQLVAEHVRHDRPDGSKDCMWRRPSGDWGLNGTRLEELPLYGSERLQDWPEEYPVVLVEGEKAADALNDTGHIFAVGTVTGAGGTPGAEALEALRGREVVLWPDSDGPGQEHMKRTGERLRGVASTLRLYTWHEAPEKGVDAADHPAVLTGKEKALGILLNDLLGAPEWEQPRSGGGSPTRNGGHRGGSEEPERFNLTDMGNAERFVACHGEDVRYCYPWTKWLVWTGARWERDETGKVHRLAKEAVRGIYGEAAAAEDEERRKALAKHATRSEAADRIRAMLELAKSEVPVSPDELDADPWLLNAPNGTVDLRTGVLRPHRREDLITKMAGAEYDPDATAPAWAAFLERVLPGGELRRFVQRAVGYSTTGDTSEQVMFINHGGGANGKSTFQEALSEALGDYSMRAPTEMLMAKRSGGVPNDVARLKGARFVSASETEQGRHLAESLVKDLTGTDTITARFMRAEFFDFEPTHKLWLSTNHKPLIRGTDLAIWRRIRLVPWAVTIPPQEQNKRLPALIQDELPGVLSWIVRGCLDWRRDGLAVPDEVRKATGDYRAEMDTLGDFLEDRCVVDPDTSVAFNDLWKAYREWCLDTEEKGESKKQFGMSLTERGFVADKGSRGVRIRRGLRLKEDFEFDSGSRSATGVADGSTSATQEMPCKTTENTEGVAHGGSNLHTNAKETTVRGVNAKTEPHAPHAPHEPVSFDLLPGESATVGELRDRRRLTEEETRQVQKLISEGMAPKFARATVIGDGGPKDEHEIEWIGDSPELEDGWERI